MLKEKITFSLSAYFRKVTDFLHKSGIDAGVFIAICALWFSINESRLNTERYNNTLYATKPYLMTTTYDVDFIKSDPKNKNSIFFSLSTNIKNSGERNAVNPKINIFYRQFGSSKFFNLTQEGEYVKPIPVSQVIPFRCKTFNLDLRKWRRNYTDKETFFGCKGEIIFHMVYYDELLNLSDETFQTVLFQYTVNDPQLEIVNLPFDLEKKLLEDLSIFVKGHSNEAKWKDYAQLLKSLENSI